MRVALVQMYCEWGNVKDNLRRSRQHIRAAKRKGADLVVFPETSMHGLWKDYLVRLAAESLDGEIVSRMRIWARELEIGVGFGLAEKTREKPYNAFVVVDKEGEVAGVHRKNNVTRLEGLFYRSDRRRPVFECAGVRMAVGICADCSREELMRSYGRRGAQVVLMPHAWDADPMLKGDKAASWSTIEEMVDFNVRGQVVGYRSHAQMLERFVERAAGACREHGYYGLFVNQVGQPHPLIPFVGPSFGMDPEGKVLARSRNKREGVLLVDVDAG
jgi:predicted amidohydrolase